MKNIFFIIALFFIQSVCAQSISVTGQWNYTIPTTDITEAGEDFTGIYTSSVNQVYIDIYYAWGWAVLVQKNNIDWDDDIQIFVHRTGNGRGSAEIVGGIVYTQINNASITLYTGSKTRLNVPLQYQIRNVSVTIPAHNYIAEIVYTLSAN